eukprot:15450324-Alexandrium_andersonii.AAC.1
MVPVPCGGAGALQSESPGSEPDVFSDAHVSRPSELRFSLAGAGFWSRAARQLTPDLHPMLGTEPHEGGQGHWLPIMGPRVSTGRAEAIAILLALHAQGPVHVGTDSMSVYRRMSRLLACMTCPPAWGLVRDGDV